ncbi:MAG: hypothetical protein ABH971_01285 [bacterium]
MPPKEKLEIVSGVAPRLRRPVCVRARTGRGFGGQAPPFRIFAGRFLFRNTFGLIQEYRTKTKLSKIFFESLIFMHLFKNARTHFERN